MSEVGPEPDDLAGELALGVLEGDARLAAERRRAEDAGFAEEVEAWEQRLALIALDETEARAPRAELWPRIAARLRTPANGTVGRLRQQVIAWRAAAAGAAAIAASLAVTLAWPRPAPPAPSVPAPVQAARLAAKSGAVIFVAVLDPSRHALVLTPASIGASVGKSPQLWVLPEGGKPLSLGVVDFGRAVVIPADIALGARGRRTLAVSLEPKGGSPTGAPTGPVLGSGELRSL